MNSEKKKSSLQAALMARPLETTEKVIKEEFLENSQPVQSQNKNNNQFEMLSVDSSDDEADIYQDSSKRHKTRDEMDIDPDILQSTATDPTSQEDEEMYPEDSLTDNKIGQDQVNDYMSSSETQHLNPQSQPAKAVVIVSNAQQAGGDHVTQAKVKPSNPYAKTEKKNVANQKHTQPENNGDNLSPESQTTATESTLKDKYSPEMRAKAAKYLANQEAASRGHIKQSIHSVLMCVMLHKQKNVLDITQNRNHLKQLRELLEIMRQADASTSLIPVDDNAEIQDPITEIPKDATTIWKKELQPYISARNCQFGNRYTQSLRLRVSTANYVDPYSMGKWITDNWAIRNNANVFHDRIQEGVKVQAACFTNVADTMNYRDLQGDLEQCVNKELLSMCQHNEDGSVNKGSRPPKKIALNVYPGTLEQIRNSQAYQALVAWVYVGKSNLNITMEILNSLNDNIVDDDKDSELINESSRMLGRNIILTVAPHLATPAHLTKLIEYQNEYFVSLDYRYIAYLPTPDIVLEDRTGKAMTL